MIVKATMKSSFLHWRKVSVDAVYHRENAPFMVRRNHRKVIPAAAVDHAEPRIPLYSTKMPDVKPHEYMPVVNFETYITDLEKIDKKLADELREVHYEPDALVRTREWEPPKEIHQSILMLYKRYYNQGKTPPIEERVLAFREAGYPDWYLMKMIKQDSIKTEQFANLGKFIEDIFGKVDTKKQAAPKKRTLKQLLNIRGGVIPVTIDASDEPKDDGCDV